MADRFCNNCGNELRPDDKFCSNCDRPVHETAMVPTPEADVEVPPLPQQGEEATPPPAEQAEPTPKSSSNSILKAFRQAARLWCAIRTEISKHKPSCVPTSMPIHRRSSVGL